MTAPEFSRAFDVRQCEGKQVRLEASGDERDALARRFDLVRIDRLEADAMLSRNGNTVIATGSLRAEFVQSCAVSAEDLPVVVNEPLFVRFVPERADHQPDQEVELGEADCDEIEYSGTSVDLGEAVAQSLALAIDPFLTGPGAEEARQRAGLLSPEESGPFAKLAALKKTNDQKR